MNSMNNEQIHEITQYLYQLLDDIDTVSDMVKGDDKAYRELVEKIQSRRFEIVDKCDGYSVSFKPL